VNPAPAQDEAVGVAVRLLVLRFVNATELFN